MTTEACSLASRSNAIATNDEIVPDIRVNDEPVQEEETALYTSFDLDEELDEILEELEDPAEDLEPVEREAIQEFAESKKKRKYLFDGINMIRITPNHSEKVRAVVGKAYWLHKKIRDKMNTMKSALIERAVGIFSGDLSDYIPKCGPQVPPLIYHCVKEIDRREPITKAWIYRTPGGNRQINKVKRRFMRGTVPNLAKYDVHVLAGAIMAFLGETREPIIPLAKWKQFAETFNISCPDAKMEQLKDLIADLPDENSTTLGFILRHLRDLSNCRHTKLPLGTSATIFGPLIIGFYDPKNEAKERTIVIETMFALLGIDSKFFGQPI